MLKGISLVLRPPGAPTMALVTQLHSEELIDDCGIALVYGEELICLIGK